MHLIYLNLDVDVDANRDGASAPQSPIRLDKISFEVMGRGNNVNTT